MAQHSHSATDVRDSRRRAALARDIVDQHTSGAENRLASALKRAREHPFLSLAVTLFAGLLLGRALRR
jgi:hypothetical protein